MEMIYVGTRYLRNARGYLPYSWVDSLFSSRADLKPSELLAHPIAIWVLPYEQISIDQNWFMNNSSKHSVLKATSLWLTTGKILINEGKNKWAQWAELHAVFLAVMEELNNNKSPDVWVYLDSWALAKGLARWSGRWAMKTVQFRTCLYGAWTYGNHYGNRFGVLR